MGTNVQDKGTLVLEEHDGACGRGILKQGVVVEVLLVSLATVQQPEQLRSSFLEFFLVVVPELETSLISSLQLCSRRVSPVGLWETTDIRAKAVLLRPNIQG